MGSGFRASGVVARLGSRNVQLWVQTQLDAISSSWGEVRRKSTLCGVCLSLGLKPWSFAPKRQKPGHACGKTQNSFKGKCSCEPQCLYETCLRLPAGHQFLARSPEAHQQAVEVVVDLPPRELLRLRSMLLRVCSLASQCFVSLRNSPRHVPQAERQSPRHATLFDTPQQDNVHVKLHCVLSCV